jgi:hypothetical protein
MKKYEQLEFMSDSMETIHYWECPSCSARFTSEESASKLDFARDLYKEGVRYKKMKYMQGLFCKSCYTDPEIQNSSL